MLGILPSTENVQADDPVVYVLSLNLHRRHLDSSQRAMIKARVRKMYEVAAKERQRLGRQHGGKACQGSMMEKVSPSSVGKSRDHVGAAVGVSGKTIDYD